MKRSTDYEAAVQELDGPAEARVNRFIAWLCFKVMALFCRAEHWLFSHPTPLPDNRPMPAEEAHTLHAVKCPQCGKLHTRGSFFCSDQCSINYLGKPPSDLFAKMISRDLPQCDSTDCHPIRPKPPLPRIPVPAPVLRRGKVVR